MEKAININIKIQKYSKAKLLVTVRNVKIGDHFSY